MSAVELVPTLDIAQSENQCDLPIPFKFEDAITAFAKTTSSLGAFDPLFKDAVKQAAKWREEKKRNSDFFLDQVLVLIYGLIIEVSRDQEARASLEKQCRTQGVHFVAKTSVATMVVRICLGVEREMGNRIAACCLELAMRCIAAKHVPEAVRTAGGVKPLARKYRNRIRGEVEKRDAHLRPKLHWDADHLPVLANSVTDGDTIYAALKPIGPNRFLVVKLTGDPEGLLE